MKKLKVAFLLLIGVTVLSACTTSNIEVISIVSPQEIYLNVGSETSIDYSVLPSDATNKDVIYHVSDQTKVSIVDGKIRGEAIGQATLTITSASNSNVKNEILVNVVDQNWPVDVIYAFAQLYLPAFDLFTTVLVEETTDTLTLEVKGTPAQQLNEVIIAFKDALVLQGWVVEGAFDTHIAKFVHPSHAFDLLLHNDVVHQGDGVELILVKAGTVIDDDHDEDATWSDVQAAALSAFEINLPELTNITAVNYHFHDGHLDINVFLTERGIALDLFLDLLVDLGYTAKEGSTHHLGTYVFGDIEIYYHESDSDITKVEFVISVDAHDHHEDATWTDVQAAALSAFEINLPELTNITAVNYHFHEGHLDINVFLTERGVALDLFLDLLVDLGYTAKEGSTHHLGTYVFGDIEIYYHESDSDATKVEFVISVDAHGHHEEIGY